MFAGFAWNRVSLVDMLGDPAGLDFSVSIVKEAMYLIMFPAKVELPHATFQVVMDLIMGTTYASELRGVENSVDKTATASNALTNIEAKHFERTSSDVSLSGFTESDQQGGKTESTCKSDMAKTEKLLWTLLTSQDGLEMTAVPDKNEAGACLRVYRRILQTAAWKPDSLANKQITKSGLLSFIAGGASTNGDVDDTVYDPARAADGIPTIVLEVEELFCILNFLAAICKALVLAHKAYEKKMISAVATGARIEGSESRLSVVSFAALFETVSVGTKSDFANSILECLNSCAFLWKRRFEASLLASFKMTSLELSKPTPSSTISPESAQAPTLTGKELFLHTIRESNRRFVLLDAPVIPASAVFRLITKNIPLPKSVHDFIHRLFAR